MMPPAAPMPSAADGPLITSMRPTTSMSVNTPLRLPSRSGVLCGMPSNKRSGTRPRKCFAEAVHCLRRFGITGHRAREHRSGVLRQAQRARNVRFGNHVDGAGNLVDRLRRARAGDDDFFDPLESEPVWSCACAAAMCREYADGTCETTQRCAQSIAHDVASPPSGSCGRQSMKSVQANRTGRGFVQSLVFVGCMVRLYPTRIVGLSPTPRCSLAAAP